MQTLTKKIAVVGATGAVGRVFLDLLNEFFPGEKELYLLPSERSQGVELACGSQVFKVADLSKFDFSEVDLAFFFLQARVLQKILLQKLSNKGAALLITLQDLEKIRMFH